MEITAKNIRAIIAEKIPEGDIYECHNEIGHRYGYRPTNKVAYSVTTKTGILDLSPHLKKWAAGLAVEHIDSNWKNVADNKGVSKELRKAAVMAHVDMFHDAGDIGTRGHKICEEYSLKWIETGKNPGDIRKFIIGEDVRLYAIARSFEHFCIDFEAEPIVSELLVFDDKDEYGGTLDSLMFITKIIQKGSSLCDEQLNIFGSKGKPHDWWYYGKDNRKMKCGTCGAKAKKVFALVDIKTSNDVIKPEYAMQVSAYKKALWRLTGLRPEETLILQLNKDLMKYNVARVLNPVKAYGAFRHVAKTFDWLQDGQSKIVPYTFKKQVFLD